MHVYVYRNNMVKVYISENGDKKLAKNGDSDGASQWTSS